jgi:TolB-like protein/class 3 adenylate cyclase
MSAAPPSHRLAAIMFTDMVGYSALCQKDERVANQLLEDHRRMVRSAIAELDGREVDTTGDGFLLEFGSALQAVRCAILLQQRQAQRNAVAPPDRRFQFRVGLHLGEIETREKNIVGDGVNIAARLEPLSPHGGVAISGAVQTLVRKQLDASFRSIGTPQLKNISEPVEVFVLDADGVASVQLSDDRPGPAPRPRAAGSKLPIAAVIAAAVVAIVALGLWRKADHAGSPGSVDKSVAVLPFENFSSDKQNEYFAAGIHDNLLTHLARVKDLKVISRTSVMQYRDGARNLRDIGKALGVANIVEGSVQRSGSRVRVQAQLIEAATDRHLWAESYDRELADVFAIQSELAQHIVTAIKATLTAAEKGRIEQRPTASAEAYDLYLRATELLRHGDFSQRDVAFRIQTLLEQAIALDPQFALAHAALGLHHTEVYWFGVDTTARRRELAKTSVETALRLQPDLAEAHLARGMFFYHCYRDYDRALAEFEEVLRRAPNSAEAHGDIAFIQRRRGQWEAALANLRRAAELDPENHVLVVDMADTFLAMRRYDDAAAAFLRASAMVPEDVGLRLATTKVAGLRDGDLAPLRRVLATIPEGVDPGEVVSFLRILSAQVEGRYTDVVALTEAFPSETFPLAVSNFGIPKEHVIGEALSAMGDTAAARAKFEIARGRLQAYIDQEPESMNLAHALASLALVQAHLGQRDQALRNAERALELLPISRDAYDGPEIAQIVAASRMRLGDHDRALAELAPLLKIPGGAHAAVLRRDLRWQPLWDDPRFQKLVADHLPKA